MADDYFDAKLALNPDTGNVVPGASALVYAQGDTTYSNPLPITDLTGIPLVSLLASPTGIYPAFRVTSGEYSVIAKAGDLYTPITSVLGSILTLLPDPSAAADGLVITVVDGEYVLGAGGGGGGGTSSSAVYYNSTSSTWPARPGVTTPVTWYSTRSPGAIKPPMTVGDMWVQHPDALEEP